MRDVRKIYDKYQEPIFRMALYSVIWQGTEYFNDENIEAAKQNILEQSAKTEGRFLIFGVPQQNAVIACATALSKCDVKDILRFVKHYLYLEGDEKLTVCCKNCARILSDNDGTLVNKGYEDAFRECDYCHEYSMEDGSVILCEFCGSYYTPNHCKEEDENTCPYCSE